MSVPEQLQKDAFGFALIEKGQKRPFEKEWQKNPTHYNSKKLEAHIAAGGNYGVIGGFGNLLILDFDDLAFFEKIKPHLAETFTVKTGSGKFHKYYICDVQPKSFKIMDEAKNTWMDAQGTGKQVVGPGSTHPNGKVYEVVDGREIAQINYGEIKALFREWLEHEIKTPFRKNDGIVDKIKSLVSIRSLLNDAGIPTSRNPTRCPFHAKGSACLSFDDSKGIWHCFHCEEGGDVFSFVMKEKNCNFKTALFTLARNNGINLSDVKSTFYEEQAEQHADNRALLREQLLQLRAMRDTEKSTEIVVQYIKKTEHIKTTRSDEKSEMYIYRNGIYVRNGRTFITEIVRDLMGDGFTTPFCNLVIKKVEADTYIDEKQFFEMESVSEIATQNGILNLQTHEVSSFSPQKIFFNKIGASYRPGIECPYIKYHLETVLKDPSDVLVIQELAGYCLLKSHQIEKAFMFLGGGRNGKGKTILLFKTFLGQENCANIPVQQLDTDPNAAAELRHKLANLGADISRNGLRETSMFKSLTGGDMISAAQKYLNRTHFINYSKQIFSANELPTTYDQTNAFFDRWVLLEFPYTFIPKDQFEMLPKEKRTNYKIRNSEIIKQLTTPDELSGFLNWAVEGLDRLLRNGNFSKGRSTEDVKDLWIRKSNSFQAFALDYLEEDWEANIPKKELRKHYATYCAVHKVRPLSDKLVKHYMEIRGVTEERANDYNRDWLWVGVKFKKSLESLTAKSAIAPQQKVLEKTLPSLPSFAKNISEKSLTTLDNHVSGKDVKETKDFPESVPSDAKGTFPEIVGILDKLDRTNQALSWVREKGTVPLFDFVEKFGEHALVVMRQKGLIFERSPGNIGVLE